MIMGLYQYAHIHANRVYTTEWPWCQVWSEVILRCHDWFLESTECTMVRDFHHGVGQKVHHWDHPVRQVFYGTSLCLCDFIVKSKLLFKKVQFPVPTCGLQLSSPRWSNTHFWPLRALHAYGTQALMQVKHSYTQNKKRVKNFKYEDTASAHKFSMKIYKVLGTGDRAEEMGR